MGASRDQCQVSVHNTWAIGPVDGGLGAAAGALAHSVGRFTQAFVDLHHALACNAGASGPA